MQNHLLGDIKLFKMGMSDAMPHRLRPRASCCAGAGCAAIDASSMSSGDSATAWVRRAAAGVASSSAPWGC